MAGGTYKVLRAVSIAVMAALPLAAVLLGLSFLWAPSIVYVEGTTTVHHMAITYNITPSGLVLVTEYVHAWFYTDAISWPVSLPQGGRVENASVYWLDGGVRIDRGVSQGPKMAHIHFRFPSGQRTCRVVIRYAIEGCRMRAGRMARFEVEVPDSRFSVVERLFVTVVVPTNILYAEGRIGGEEAEASLSEEGGLRAVTWRGFHVEDSFRGVVAFNATGLNLPEERLSLSVAVPPVLGFLLPLLSFVLPLVVAEAAIRRRAARVGPETATSPVELDEVEVAVVLSEFPIVLRNLASVALFLELCRRGSIALEALEDSRGRVRVVAGILSYPAGYEELSGVIPPGSAIEVKKLIKKLSGNAEMWLRGPAKSLVQKGVLVAGMEAMWLINLLAVGAGLASFLATSAVAGPRFAGFPFSLFPAALFLLTMLATFMMAVSFPLRVVLTSLGKAVKDDLRSGRKMVKFSGPERVLDFLVSRDSSVLEEVVRGFRMPERDRERISEELVRTIMRFLGLPAR